MNYQRRAQTVRFIRLRCCCWQIVEALRCVRNADLDLPRVIDCLREFERKVT